MSQKEKEDFLISQPSLRHLSATLLPPRRRLAALSPTPPRQLPLHGILAPDERLQICWTPKVASRFLVGISEDMTNCKQHPVADCPPETTKGTMALPVGCSPSHINRCKGISTLEAWLDPDFYHVAVIRDPLTRFVSAFLDKYSTIALQTNPFNSGNQLMRNQQTWLEYLKASNTTPSVTALLAAIKTDNQGLIAEDVDEHLRSQTILCRPKSVHYEYIILQQNFSSSFPDMLNQLRLNAWTKHIHNLLANDSSAFAHHARHANKLTCSLTRPRDITMIRILYAQDYNWFAQAGLQHTLLRC